MHRQTFSQTLPGDTQCGTVVDKKADSQDCSVLPCSISLTQDSSTLDTEPSSEVSADWSNITGSKVHKYLTS